MEYIHYNVPGMPSDIYYGTAGISFRMVSHPRKTDSDGDGIDDLYDKNPLVSINPIFKLIDKNKYGDMPDHAINYFQKAQEASDSRYKKLYDDVHNYYHLKAINQENDTVWKNAWLIASVGGMLNLSHASDFMFHFLEGSGDLIEFDAKELLESAKSIYRISTSPYCTIVEQLNSVIEMCEEISLDTKRCFSTDVGVMSLNMMSNYSLSQLNKIYGDPDFDWFTAVGEVGVAMSVKCKETNGIYTADVTYYITDFYDWQEGDFSKNGFLSLWDGELFNLHYAGKAKQFPVLGKCTLTLTWDQGERLVNEGNSMSGDIYISYS